MPDENARRHIAIEGERTDDGTFVRAFIDGVESHDDDTTRALVRKAMFAVSSFAFKPGASEG